PEEAYLAEKFGEAYQRYRATVHRYLRASGAADAKGSRMETFKREPFRLLFPLSVLLAWAAVLPWVLFGAGLTRAWLGAFHALTMTQGFLVAVAVGFLATMIPRRTGTAPPSTVELLLWS